jgi:hypothetical protein
MPPWFADPKYGHFANDRPLKQSEIDTILSWADGGAKEGDAKDAPPAVAWPADGWQIQPDYVVKGPEYDVPAKGVLEWTNFVVPSGFTKDTWITTLEIKPSALPVTHHICVSFIAHTPEVEYGVPLWIDKQRDESGSEVPREKNDGSPDCRECLETTGSAWLQEAPTLAGAKAATSPVFRPPTIASSTRPSWSRPIPTSFLGRTTPPSARP